MRRVARQLGRYHILDRIAFGGMAEIFRALTFADNGDVTLVAIKQVLPHYAEDHEFIDMLVDEAKLVSMLHHKNIVEIFEVGNIEDVYFVAMECVVGKDVRAVLERCRTLGTRIPFEVSAHLLAEALNGLDTAHRLLDADGNTAGLVHRDFSPSNILISYDGSVKICDFGIAKANFSRIQTKTGVIKGKVKYMSPEQAFGRKLDHRSDVFSAGSVLYEMLTTEPPFVAKNEIDLIFMVRDARITPPRELYGPIPDSLEKAVFKGMSRARGSRYQSAAEFRQALLAYLRRRGAGDWKAELARFMRSLYADDMAREKRSLASFDLHVEEQEGDLGTNLIADVLGANAPYTKFNPFPTKAQQSPGDAPVHDFATRILQLEATEEGATQIHRTGVERESPPPAVSDEEKTVAREAPPDDEGEKTRLWTNPGPRPLRPATSATGHTGAKPPPIPADARRPLPPVTTPPLPDARAAGPTSSEEDSMKTTVASGGSHDLEPDEVETLRDDTPTGIHGTIDAVPTVVATGASEASPTADGALFDDNEATEVATSKDELATQIAHDRAEPEGEEEQATQIAHGRILPDGEEELATQIAHGRAEPEGDEEQATQIARGRALSADEEEKTSDMDDAPTQIGQFPARPTESSSETETSPSPRAGDVERE